MTPTNQSHEMGAMKAASTIALLAGIWLFISPWVYGAYTNGNAFNSWIVGALIAILAGIQLSSLAVSSGLAWINCLLAIWTFISPWVFGYTGNTGRFVNSLCVGVIVFLVEIRNAVSPMHPSHPVGVAK